jgi:RecA/RadA recombinase
MDFLKEMINVSGNKFASKVEDGLDGSDVCGYIDTGSYTFNALLSGSLFDGLPSNKITCLAGESATGKTYFSIGVVAQFLAANPEGIVLYFDTEQAVTSDMFTERGVDPKRIAVFPVETVEEFRHQCLTIVDKVLATDESERKPMMIVLDSLGMLSTSKEMNDVAEGKNVRDMTRAQVIKGTFRVLTLKLGKAKIPMIMTNHTYDVVGAYVPTKELGGGSGLKYAASTIVTLSKKKDKQDDEVVGNIITCKLYKSRLTKENKIVQVQLNFDSGLNRYYGLVDLALDYGIFKKNSTKIELPDGTKAFEKHINEEPEKYFTQEILKQIDERVQEDFKYG